MQPRRFLIPRVEGQTGSGQVEAHGVGGDAGILVLIVHETQRLVIQARRGRQRLIPPGALRGFFDPPAGPLAQIIGQRGQATDRPKLSHEHYGLPIVMGELVDQPDRARHTGGDIRLKVGGDPKVARRPVALRDRLVGHLAHEVGAELPHVALDRQDLLLDQFRNRGLDLESPFELAGHLQEELARKSWRRSRWEGLWFPGVRVEARESYRGRGFCQLLRHLFS